MIGAAIRTLASCAIAAVLLAGCAENQHEVWYEFRILRYEDDRYVRYNVQDSDLQDWPILQKAAEHLDAQPERREVGFGINEEERKEVLDFFDHARETVSSNGTSPWGRYAGVFVTFREEPMTLTMTSVAVD